MSPDRWMCKSSAPAAATRHSEAVRGRPFGGRSGTPTEFACGHPRHPRDGHPEAPIAAAGRQPVRGPRRPSGCPFIRAGMEWMAVPEWRRNGASRRNEMVGVPKRPKTLPEESRQDVSKRRFPKCRFRNAAAGGLVGAAGKWRARRGCRQERQRAASREWAVRRRAVAVARPRCSGLASAVHSRGC
jgi:hypothetical protein